MKFPIKVEAPQVCEGSKEKKKILLIFLILYLLVTALLRQTGERQQDLRGENSTSAAPQEFQFSPKMR